MYTVTKFPHGTFSWADCATTDAANGKEFYADLMGWGKNDVPIGDDEFYTMFTQGEHSVAALSQMPAEMQSQGMPARWNSYVTVDDVDAITTKAKSLGATIVMEPFDVFDSGRMSVIQDPTGAHLSLWQAKNHIGAGLVNMPGAMCWNELGTPDSDKAREFYGGLLGWEFQKLEKQDYHVILNNGRANGGVFPITAEMGERPPAWTVSLSVADIDAAVEKVESLGGKIIMPATEAGGTGRFSIIADPQGAVVSLIQLQQPQPWDVN